MGHLVSHLSRFSPIYCSLGEQLAIQKRCVESACTNGACLAADRADIFETEWHHVQTMPFRYSCVLGFVGLFYYKSLETISNRRQVDDEYYDFNL